MLSNREKDIESTGFEIEDQELSIRDYKQDEGNAKSQMTRPLNKAASMMCDDDLNTEILELLQRIQEQQKNTLTVMNRLESAYRQKNDGGLAEKISDEADSPWAKRRNPPLSQRRILGIYIVLKHSFRQDLLL